MLPYNLVLGYWISSSWLSNAKKYVDSLVLSTFEIPNRKSPSKKKPVQRQRRGSDGLPPCSAMNADILCPHGGLSVSSGIKTKRRAVSSKMWHFLRRFYPDGPQFKCSHDTECIVCISILKDAKTAEADKKGMVIMERRTDMVPDALAALVARKGGVPADCLTSRVSALNNELGQEDIHSSNVSSVSTVDGPSDADLRAIELALLLDGDGALQQPLVPGLYNLVPKRWLKAWRHYIKDANAPFLPHLDCAAFFCQPHGLLVVPPHVEEYLLGIRRSLLAGLGSYPGEVAEIISADEWDALQDVFHGAADFSVRLCLDGGGVSWNTGVCFRCDPFAYHPLLQSANKKKTRNGQQLGGLVV